MKKVNLNGKLSFKKETIAKLNNEQMNVVKGGTSGACPTGRGATCGGTNCGEPTGSQTCNPTNQSNCC